MATRNLTGFTLLDRLPDLAFRASDGTQSTLVTYFSGSWGLLFSHPDDFTPICTTELANVARLDHTDAFSSRHVKLAALSCNSIESHAEWIQDIEAYAQVPVRYPIIADDNRAIASALGMLSQDDMDPQHRPLTVRTVFILDPDVRIRLMMTYPATTGRNFEEILRVIDSIQLCTDHPVATPANWRVGDRVCLMPHVKDDTDRTVCETVVLPSQRGYLRFTSNPYNK